VLEILRIQRRRVDIAVHNAELLVRQSNRLM
jgi:hypothetical protein